MVNELLFCAQRFLDTVDVRPVGEGLDLILQYIQHRCRFGWHDHSD